MDHTLVLLWRQSTSTAEDWRQRAGSMESKVPSRDIIIPVVAARLKYYLDVERKEAGFDLSINPKDGKHRLYQPTGRHSRHQPQRLKENFLDNKLEASFRSYNWRPKKSKHKIWRQRRVESCSENSDIFRHSLSAIHNHDTDTLRKLCLSYFFLPSITDEEGKTLLHHAASQEDPSICQVLLDTNVGLVNIDQQDRFGKTALHYAVQKVNPKIIRILLDNGAKEEIPDKKSQTVLDLALYKVQTQ